ncbi:T-cell surface glycoprotein CD3 zeta chain-like [Cottoperca gobio]|uniref:T-cell surface glycoprotein CD3 zeta chain-like n=1 Tax=Cottoperca gobio TaxID=56716 RepID=A0A6J2RVZ2_COTGO|nr:T-cell surface glycoprotein CD3 zeta chain-like [Cottoperca gobio]
MDAAGVFVLLVFLPVSSAEMFFTEPVICYFLDAFLIVYCIGATALFFREKFSFLAAAAGEPKEECIYQELDRPTDSDPYQVLQPAKRKAKAGKKKKSGSPPAVQDKDPYESLLSNGSSPPAPSPH